MTIFFNLPRKNLNAGVFLDGENSSTTDRVTALEDKIATLRANTTYRVTALEDRIATLHANITELQGTNNQLQSNTNVQGSIEFQTLGLFCVTCQMSKMNLLLHYIYLNWTPRLS